MYEPIQNEFDAKIKKGHIFSYRWSVTTPDEKFTTLASGDTWQEAICDANRLQKKLGLPLYPDDSVVKRCNNDYKRCIELDAY